MSVLLRPDIPPSRLHLVASSVALAAADAVSGVNGVRPLVKWPNDLLIDGRKLAGVLAESDLRQNGSGQPDRPAVVVGVGVNLNWPATFPEELHGTAVSLNHLVGREVDPRSVLAGLLDSLDVLYGQWDDVVKEYRRRCATLGTRVRAELPGEVLVGTAVDVTDEGHLVVDVGGRRRTLVAGDVVHLRDER